MALSEEKLREYSRRLLLSRMRILCSHGFYGLLLMHMVYSIDETLSTVAADGVRVAFAPDFLDRLTDRELDYVLMHEILHIVLGHCHRRGDRDSERFDIACDVVVNSNILLENGMDERSITIRGEGAARHLAPNGKEGSEYTAEQVYELLSAGSAKGDASSQGSSSNNSSGQGEDTAGQSAPDDMDGGGGEAELVCGMLSDGDGNGDSSSNQGSPGQASPGKNLSGWDDHSRWGTHGEDDALRDEWMTRFENACKAMEIRDPSNDRGLLPAFAERMLKELRQPRLNWREVLNDFIQEEVVDYSFVPPDRRFGDSPFFLPDLSEKSDSAEKILFMIDTSGSMSDDMITDAYSEIKGAIDQFDGRLKGWLGFFDAVVVEPRPFDSVEEFQIIRPEGGGGTDFKIIFEYIIQHMQDDLPVSIVILTDGYAPFPEENMARGIPVLWLLNNEEVEPPWGRTARITA